MLTFRRSAGNVRFVGFPFGGGGAHSFRNLANALPPEWGVTAIEPPFHVRTAGPPVGDLDALCALYLDRLGVERFAGAILYGHSVGGLVAAGIARRIELLGAPAAALVLAASRPPATIDRIHRLSAMTDAELFAWWSRMLHGVDGLSNGVVLHDLFAVFREAIRADLELFESADEQDVRGLRTPVLALGGQRDDVCPWELLSAWTSVSPQAVVRRVPGGHLFMLEHPDAVADAVSAFVKVAC